VNSLFNSLLCSISFLIIFWKSGSFDLDIFGNIIWSHSFWHAQKMRTFEMDKPNNPFQACHKMAVESNQKCFSKKSKSNFKSKQKKEFFSVFFQAVIFVDMTVVCMTDIGYWIPPSWLLCLESVSHLLVSNIVWVFTFNNGKSDRLSFYIY
jgi:hypothetical protein